MNRGFEYFENIAILGLPGYVTGGRRGTEEQGAGADGIRQRREEGGKLLREGGHLRDEIREEQQPRLPRDEAGGVCGRRGTQ